MRRRLLALAAAAALPAAVAALLAPAAAAGAVALTATVGPGFEIALVDESGRPVQQLDPGTYDITVEDRSDEHNFHLFGPGVDQASPLVGTGTFRWSVTVREGRYTFVCDPHSGVMRGAFVVGNPPPAPPPPAPPPPRPPAPPRLVATVGAQGVVSLRTAAGALVRRLSPRVYTISVRDRSRRHNVHLIGAGVNRRTAVARIGTFTWRVTLRRGKLAFYSDRAPLRLRRSVAVR